MNEVTLRIMNPDGSPNSEVKFTPARPGQVALNTSRGSQYVSVDDTTPLVLVQIPDVDTEVHKDGKLNKPSAVKEEEVTSEEPPAEATEETSTKKKA